MSGDVLRVEMLGTLRVSHAGHEYVLGKRAAALLSYLAYHPEKKIRREVLVNALFREYTDPGSKNRLASMRNAIQELKTFLLQAGLALGQVLETTSSTISLHSSALSTDVADFNSSLMQANVSSENQLQYRLEAIQLYRGPFLHGSNAAWAVLERTNLRTLYLEALHNVALYFAEQGAAETALEFANKAYQEDAERIDATLLLIRVHVLLRHPGNASQYNRDLPRLLQRTGISDDEEIKRILEQAHGYLVAPKPTSNANHAKAKTSSSVCAADTSLVTTSQQIGNSLPPSNLYVPSSSFVGREQEKKIISALCLSLILKADKTDAPTPQSLLITLFGLGGIGKTRFALEVAWSLRSIFREAVWFIKMPVAEDAAPIIGTIAATLGCTSTVSDDLFKQICAILSSQPSLLVIDRVERLHATKVSAQADKERDTLLKTVIKSLLSHIPNLAILVTSRRVLGIKDECLFPLDALSVPLEMVADAFTFDELMKFPAIQMFRDRARAANPRFELTGKNAATVVQICQCTEGIPLAIELAAAQMRTSTMTIGQLRVRLNNHHERLELHDPISKTDQPSLWAIIDASYSHLPRVLQRLLAHLAVFRGGWTLEDAMQFCSADVEAIEDLSEETLDQYLTELRNSSMIIVEEREEISRFRMFDLIHDFVMETLPPRERRVLEERHARYFLALAIQAQEHLTNSPEWLKRLDAEVGNLRADLDWLIRDEVSPQEGLALANALGRFWEIRGYWQEGRTWFDRIIVRSGAMAASSAWGTALLHQGRLAYRQRENTKAEEYLRTGLSIAQHTHSDNIEREIISNLANVIQAQGRREEAWDLFRGALGLAQEAGDRLQEARILHNMAVHYFHVEELEEAYDLFEQSRQIKSQLGEQYSLLQTLEAMGVIAHWRGEFPNARHFLEEALSLADALDDKAGRASSMLNLAEVERYQGNFNAANTLNGEALRIYKRLGLEACAALVILNMGISAKENGDIPTALRLCNEARPIASRLDDTSLLASADTLEGNIAMTQKRVAEAFRLHSSALTGYQRAGNMRGVATAYINLAEVATAQKEFNLARTHIHTALELYRAHGLKPGYAFVVMAYADLAFAEAHWERSTRLYAASQSVRHTMGMPLPPDEEKSYQAHLAILRSTLGDQFAAEWTGGTHLATEDALEFAAQFSVQSDLKTN